MDALRKYFSTLISNICRKGEKKRIIAKIKSKSSKFSMYNYKHSNQALLRLSNITPNIKTKIYSPPTLPPNLNFPLPNHTTNIPFTKSRSQSSPS